MSKKYVALVEQINSGIINNTVNITSEDADLIFTLKNNYVLKVKLNLKTNISNIIDADAYIGQKTPAPITHKQTLEHPDEYAEIPDDVYTDFYEAIESIFNNVGYLAAFLTDYLLINTEYFYNRDDILNEVKDPQGKWLKKFNLSYKDGLVFPEGQFQLTRNDIDQLKSDLAEAFYQKFVETITNKNLQWDWSDRDYDPDFN